MALVVLGLLMLSVPQVASAQGIGEARYGQRYFTLGFVSQPGFVLDPDEPVLADQSQRTVSWGAMGLVALHHFLHPKFSMSAELALGALSIDAHPVSHTGAHDDELVFSRQVGLIARFIPSGELRGLSAGLGMHSWSANLEDGRAQQVAADLRLGWLLWTGSRSPRFALIEFGWSVPLIQGVQAPDFVFADDMQAREPSNWYWTRGVIGLQASF